MPVLHFPSSLPELMTLAFVVVGFGSFIVTLLAVSISVTLSEQPAERLVVRRVAPAKRAQTA